MVYAMVCADPGTGRHVELMKPFFGGLGKIITSFPCQEKRVKLEQIVSKLSQNSIAPNTRIKYKHSTRKRRIRLWTPRK